MAVDPPRRFEDVQTFAQSVAFFRAKEREAMTEPQEGAFAKSVRQWVAKQSGENQPDDAAPGYIPLAAEGPIIRVECVIDEDGHIGEYRVVEKTGENLSAAARIDREEWRWVSDNHLTDERAHAVYIALGAVDKCPSPVAVDFLRSSLQAMRDRRKETNDDGR